MQLRKTLCDLWWDDDSMWGQSHLGCCQSGPLSVFLLSGHLPFSLESVRRDVRSQVHVEYDNRERERQLACWLTNKPLVLYHWESRRCTDSGWRTRSDSGLSPVRKDKVTYKKGRILKTQTMQKMCKKENHILKSKSTVRGGVVDVWLKTVTISFPLTLDRLQS